MKLSLETNFGPIETLGNLDAVEVIHTSAETKVFLDGKRCPPTLERIILTGMNTMAEQYLNEVEMMMRLERGE